MKTSIKDLFVDCEVHGKVPYHARSEWGDDIVTVYCPKCETEAQIERFIEETLDACEFWYVCSPYAAATPAEEQARVKAVAEVVSRLMKENPHAFIFSPILYTDPLQVRGDVPELGWYAYDLIALAKADRCIVADMEGSDASLGIKIEIDFAEKNEIPVEYYKVA